MKLCNFRAVFAALAVMLCAISVRAEVSPAVQRIVDKFNEVTAAIPALTDVNQINQTAESINALESTITPEEAVQPLTEEDREALANALTDFTIVVATRSCELTGQADPLGGMTRDMLYSMMLQHLQELKTVKDILDD